MTERKIPHDGYLEVEMPEQFTLEIRDHNRGRWTPWAALRADWFIRDEDGTYVCTAHGGSPVYIRALSVDPAGVIEHVDGDGFGAVHGYRLVPLQGTDSTRLTSKYGAACRSRPWSLPQRCARPISRRLAAQLNRCRRVPLTLALPIATACPPRRHRRTWT